MSNSSGTIDRFKDISDKFLTENHLAINKDNDWEMVDEILNMSRKEIENLDGRTANGYAFALSQYTLIIQIKMNKYEAFIGYGRNMMGRIQNNEKNDLRKAMDACEVQKGLLMYVSKRLEMMITCLSNIGRSRNG